MASPLPTRASIRDFSLVRTRDQWRRCSHERTEVVPGGVVELASQDYSGQEPAQGLAETVIALVFPVWVAEGFLVPPK